MLKTECWNQIVDYFFVADWYVKSYCILIQNQVMTYFVTNSSVFS